MKHTKYILLLGILIGLQGSLIFGSEQGPYHIMDLEIAYSEIKKTESIPAHTDSLQYFTNKIEELLSLCKEDTQNNKKTVIKQITINSTIKHNKHLRSYYITYGNNQIYTEKSPEELISPVQITFEPNKESIIECFKHSQKYNPQYWVDLKSYDLDDSMFLGTQQAKKGKPAFLDTQESIGLPMLIESIIIEIETSPIKQTQSYTKNTDRHIIDFLIKGQYSVNTYTSTINLHVSDIHKYHGHLCKTMESTGGRDNVRTIKIGSYKISHSSSYFSARNIAIVGLIAVAATMYYTKTSPQQLTTKINSLAKMAYRYFGKK